MKNNSSIGIHAQGTIEYLVIIAVIVVIALVVVSLMTSLTNQGSTISSTSSDLMTKTGVGGISIVDIVAGKDKNALIVLKNNSGENLTVEKVTVNGVDHIYDEPVVIGGQTGFRLQDVASCDGTVKSYTIKITYASSSNLSKPADFKEVTVDCVAAVSSSSSSSGTVVEEIKTPLAPSLNTPYVWASNYYDANITQLSPAGAVLAKYPVGGGPWGVAVDADNNAWVANVSGGTVSKLSPLTGLVGSFSLGPGAQPVAVAVDANNNIWVTNEAGDNNIFKFNSSGVLLGSFSAGNGPQGIAVDAGNNIWVARWYANSVSKFSSSGVLLGSFPVGSGPFGVAVDADNNIWVTNFYDKNVSKLTPSGTLLGKFSAGSGAFGGPQTVAVDANNNIWVASVDGNVTKLSSSGALLGIFPMTSSKAYGIAVDSNNNIWVTDANSSVFKLNTSGAIIGTFSSGNGPNSVGDFTGFALQYFVLGRRS
ncbi:MAG: NHL repeat-containing protein [archaeon]